MPEPADNGGRQPSTDLLNHGLKVTYVDQVAGALLAQPPARPAPTEEVLT